MVGLLKNGGQHEQHRSENQSQQRFENNRCHQYCSSIYFLTNAYINKMSTYLSGFDSTQLSTADIIFFLFPAQRKYFARPEE